jgi:pimeloyl-ACP methyl ester carboxylesterase
VVGARGPGRALLLLHPGDGLDQESPFLALLASRYRVIAPSHPGFGASGLPAWMNSVDDLAYFYLDFIAQHGLKDFVLVGVSFGAWLAAEIAIKCQHGMAGLVLADAVGAKFEGPQKREILDLFAYPLYEQAEHIYADAARRKPDYKERSEAALLRLARNHATFALMGWSPTLHHPKLRHRLHRITVPTQLLWGAEDRVVPPDYGKRFAAAIPGAQFSLIEGAGHYPHIEQPEAFGVALDKFVATLP